MLRAARCASLRGAMLFSSGAFIYVFLPLVLLVDVLLSRASHTLRYGALLLASLIFYAYWRPPYLLVILASIGVNYALGRRLALEPGSRKSLLPLGVALNLLALGYYKYAAFTVGALSALLGTSWSVPPILLPLGISFFTFQQIAFLVDSARGESRETHFLDYALFVAFFPQLIAGPIVHHAELMPQLARAERPALLVRLGSGIPLFAAGLFKKAVLADGVAPFANSVFSSADSGGVVTFVDGWIGALAYALQLYFDFSGYSDMALGLGLMFGVQLPLNFDSPYQARSIIEFWRRWHITLSRFLRDYVYVPLGGNRLGRGRRYANLMVTMLLGGLWHGAGFNFVLWGGLHGALLCLNHGYRKLWSFAPAELQARAGRSRALSSLHWALTFVAVLFAWVPFRAQSFEGALRVAGAMLRFDHVQVPAQLGPLLPSALAAWVEPSVSWVVSLRDPVDGILRVTALLAVALFLPNVHTLLSHHAPALGVTPSPRRVARVFAGYRLPVAACAGLALGAALVLMSEDEFLYFNF